MMDRLVGECQKCGLRGIYGYYYPTAKNGMVKDFYKLQGFELVTENTDGSTVWYFEIPEEYKNKNKVIEVK